MHVYVTMRQLFSELFEVKKKKTKKKKKQKQKPVHKSPFSFAEVHYLSTLRHLPFWYSECFLDFSQHWRKISNGLIIDNHMTLYWVVTNQV
jgi:hypothetical protein